MRAAIAGDYRLDTIPGEDSESIRIGAGISEMDELYRGIETSLLALTLLLGLAAATTSSLPRNAPVGAAIATTLPMISVTAE